MTAQSPFAVANYFIKKAAEEKVPLTPMKLIKLVYLAHGWHLALTGEPLIREPIEAWKYGPVIESLYHAFKSYGNSSLPADAATQAQIKGDDAEQIERLLNRVWDKYGKYTAAQLSTLTHQKETPWSITYDPNEMFTVIPDSVIADHYRELIHASRERAGDQASPAATAAGKF